ncbi:hypothetical protein CFC21_047805 [Triticum aestivum]|uniref:PGG domain-containing protein n=2 Tax=Triticum aestivum TaxID=4565 RepID=A0A9R1FZ06_WHEAT|nr:uncharacterized protein LOC123100762 [Triticum aestivum]KAF7037438.1 hypothetical protein CFC21_047805 [Triticum aestivum]
MVSENDQQDLEFLWKWRRYLLLLATLVASVTYGAGLNPPGAVWSQDQVPGSNSAREHRAGAVHRPTPLAPAPAAVYPFRVGDPVLVSTYSHRYTVFFYCNATAFVASLVIIMFLLDRRISNNPVGLAVLRLAMLLDLLALMAAFAAGSCRNVVASIYVSALFAVVFVYVAIHHHVPLRGKAPDAPTNTEEKRRLKERRKFLFLLATFATPLTYAAGLAPPGGFWSETMAGHRAGAPLLHDGRYKIRYHAFFYANANSFVASLAIIMWLMINTLRDRLGHSEPLLVCVLVELVGLMAAYAAGSCRWITTTVYIVSLIGAVLLYIVLHAAVVQGLFNFNICGEAILQKLKSIETTITVDDGQEDKLEQSRSLVLLLATLATTVTYQAGLNPPGGVWPEGQPNHTAGNPVLHDMHPKRYMAFYHCNTAAFVASVVVIIIVESKRLSTVWGAMLLKTAMVLDLFGLTGAYVAGSCRDTTTTIYVSALAVAVFVYSIAKVIAFKAGGKLSLAMRCMQSIGNKLLSCMPSSPSSDELEILELERTRKFLLQLAILAATVTYQTGLNPPGGFWQETESKGERSLTAGDPVLLDHYGVRYQVFFYCNATGFMASVAVILLLVHPTLSKEGIRSMALQVCVIVGLLGLMGAYATGSCRKLRTSIYVFALVAAVVAFLVLEILLYLYARRRHFWFPQCLQKLQLLKPLSSAPDGRNKGKGPTYPMRKSLMLLGILAASVTYQAGLAPPGGTWGDDDTASYPSLLLAPSPPASYLSHAGNPILLDTYPKRYQAFFYCNATSFVASIVVIMLALHGTVKKGGTPFWVIHGMRAAMVLDLLGLLGAYAAGSCRDSETSAYVITLVTAVVVFITIYVMLSIGRRADDDLSDEIIPVTSLL